ncbi:hypothetical protein MPSEU_000283300 [Mayamaea pseudoterrestris]|nr:hypothetical protein MPSEU_000283300 [Mayamaea pseudoterrestris]
MSHRRNHRAETQKDSAQSDVEEPDVTKFPTEFAGGESLLKGSPGSSVSFSQSPGLWKHRQFDERQAPNDYPIGDNYKPSTKRPRVNAAPPESLEPLSKLDIFLGIHPSLKALDGKKPAAKVKTTTTHRNAASQGRSQPKTQLFAEKGEGDSQLVTAAVSTAVNGNGHEKAARKETESAAPSVQKAAPNPGIRKRRIVDEEDDDEFFANLFGKKLTEEQAVPTTKRQGISKSVQAALDEAKSPPPTPAKRSTETFSAPLQQQQQSDMSNERDDFMDDSPLQQSHAHSSRPSSPIPAATNHARSESPASERRSRDSSPEDKPRYSWNSRKTARNPLTQLKEDREQALQRNSQPTKQPSQAMEDSLWDDSDEDDKPSPPKKKNSRSKKDTVADSPKARGRANINDESPPAKPTAKLHATTSGKTTTKRPAAAETDCSPASPTSRINVLDDKYSSEKLIPEFEEPKWYFPEIGPLAIGPDESNRFHVPASITRYLGDYQRDGVEFMCNATIDYGGALLGDDMGLGKTVQVIALLAALLKKRGNGEDRLELDRRVEIARRNRQRIQDEKDFAIQNGRLPPQDYSQLDLEAVNTPAWAPILLLVPTNIVDHWKSDLDLWGHFGVAIYRSGGPKLAPLIESIQLGTSEILLCSTSMFTQAATLDELKRVEWKLIVIDELHFAKNKNVRLSMHLRELKNGLRDIRVIGLSGTPLQNAQIELWNVVDLVIQGHLGSEKEFDVLYGNPIRKGRAKDAKLDDIKHAEEAKHELNETKLQMVHLRRTKEQQLKDELPSKNERVVFCSMTKIQKAIYQHTLSQPDFVCIKNTGALCDCGVNADWCERFLKLKTREEQIEFQRRNKSALKTKAECCYRAPFENGMGDEGDAIHPNAVIWLHQHPKEHLCLRCPYCCILPAMTILSKVCSHASLIQVDRHNASGKSKEDFEYAKDMARVFLPKEVVNDLPGKGIYRESASSTDEFTLSGKMMVLHRLLINIQKKNGRVLLFSESTQTLDLIEQYIMGHYDYLRMDGKTPKELRTSIAEQFKQDITKFVLLLSKKAFGTGLTLTAANYVILFDTDWNPATDSQAQDRAFRIGQKQDVTVFRMVTKGTIEELRYLRQVYKIQLKDETIADNENPDQAGKKKRLFRGVAGDKDRKGELFGVANLLKFKDGFFHNYGKASKESVRSFGEDVHNVDEVLEEMSPEEAEKLVGEDEAMSSEAIADIAQDLAKGGHHGNVDDESEDEDLGGQSQLNMDILDKMKRSNAASEEEEEHDAHDVLSKSSFEAAQRLRAFNNGGMNSSPLAASTPLARACPQTVDSSPSLENGTKPALSTPAAMNAIALNSTTNSLNNSAIASRWTKMTGNGDVSFPPVMPAVAVVPTATMPAAAVTADPLARPENEQSAALSNSADTTASSKQPEPLSAAFTSNEKVDDIAPLPPPPPATKTTVPMTSNQTGKSIRPVKTTKKLRNFFFCGANPDRGKQLDDDGD